MMELISEILITIMCSLTIAYMIYVFVETIISNREVRELTKKHMEFLNAELERLKEEDE